MNDLFLAMAEAAAHRRSRPSPTATGHTHRWPALLAACGFATLGAAWAAPQPAPILVMHPAKRVTNTDGAADFDFLIGRWTVENRKLLKPLTGSTAWEEFPATQTVQRLPGGIGNFDDYLAESWRPGFVGMTLRVFNPVTQRWSIYWLTNRDGGIDAKTGALTPPVVGRFQDGIGVFEGADTFDGKPILMRFTWTPQGAAHARWEQAFSTDGGAVWETNWVMVFSRVAG